MRTTFSVSFYCRESKKDKKGLAPIQASVIINGERMFMNLLRKEEPKVFEKLVNSRRDNELKQFLNVERERLNNSISELVSHSIPVTLDTLKEYMRTGGIKSYTVEDLFNEYYNLLKQRVGHTMTEGVFQKYERARDLFYEEVGKDMELTQINNGIIQRFYNKINQGYKTSTGAGIMTKIKTVMTYAMDNDKLKVNPFSQIKITKAKPDITHLTMEDIESIINHDFHNERLERVRDCFIVQCATGLSYVDLKHLEMDDIKNDNGTLYIQKDRIKTGNDYTAVVLPFAMPIIAKYKGKLPVLSNQKYNSYLAEIEALCGLKIHITTHIARHSYATLLLNKGVRLEIVSKTLGHSSTKVTQAHYAKVMTSTILSEVSRVM